MSRLQRLCRRCRGDQRAKVTQRPGPSTSGSLWLQGYASKYTPRPPIRMWCGEQGADFSISLTRQAIPTAKPVSQGSASSPLVPEFQRHERHQLLIFRLQDGDSHPYNQALVKMRNGMKAPRSPTRVPFVSPAHTHRQGVLGVPATRLGPQDHSVPLARSRPASCGVDWPCELGKPQKWTRGAPLGTGGLETQLCNCLCQEPRPALKGGPAGCSHSALP